MYEFGVLDVLVNIAIAEVIFDSVNKSWFTEKGLSWQTCVCMGGGEVGSLAIIQAW